MDTTEALFLEELSKDQPEPSRLDELFGHLIWHERVSPVIFERYGAYLRQTDDPRTELFFHEEADWFSDYEPVRNKMEQKLLENTYHMPETLHDSLRVYTRYGHVYYLSAFNQQGINGLKDYVVPLNLKSITMLRIKYDQDEPLDVFSIAGTVLQFEQLRSLSLSCTGLTRLPEFVVQIPKLTDLEYPTNIELSENLLECTKLKKLDLSGTGLATLPEWIGEMKNLEELDLRANELTHLPNSIANLKNLRRLDLRSNKLESIPESVCQLEKLEYFAAEFNYIGDISDAVGQLKNLQELRLYENSIRSLPDSLGDLASLKVLDLKANLFSELPHSIGSLSQLQELELYYNHLTSLPESIRKLRNLTNLSVPYNKLRKIPDFIGELTNLENLNFAHNSDISAIPVSIGNLRKLKFLSMEQYGQSTETIESLKRRWGAERAKRYITPAIETLPDEIGNLQALRSLNLKGHRIRKLPDSIGKLTQLEYLNLDDNDISELPESMIALKNLEELSLRKTNIEHLPDWTRQLTAEIHLEKKETED